MTGPALGRGRDLQPLDRLDSLFEDHRLSKVDVHTRLQALLSAVAVRVGGEGDDWDPLKIVGAAANQAGGLISGHGTCAGGERLCHCTCRGC